MSENHVGATPFGKPLKLCAKDRVVKSEVRYRFVVDVASSGETA
jgi:hypothetical protein